MCVVGSAERVAIEPVTVDEEQPAKPTHVSVKCRLGQHKKSSESGITTGFFTGFYFALLAE